MLGVAGNIQHQQIDLEDECGPPFVKAIERTVALLKKLNEDEGDELDRHSDPGKSPGAIIRKEVDLIALRMLAWMKEANASEWAVSMYQHSIQEGIRNVLWGSYREVDA